MRTPSLLCTLAALVWGLTACSPSPPLTPTEADFQRGEQLTPADPVLAERYDRSCRVCHATRSATAPLAGHAPSWQPRLNKGMDVLLAAVKDGYGGMPARGLCSDCTDDELRQLIDFLVEGR